MVISMKRCTRSKRLSSDYLPNVTKNLDAECPARLAAAMRYSTLNGGKRLRPILCLMAAAERAEATVKLCYPLPAPFEIVHTYSLIHDDLPMMDNDHLRRGRSTCHRAFDEATAVLAGDALLTSGLRTLSSRS